MPEWVDETYWESGKEKSLGKRHFIYDQHGNSAQEEIYDADGNHVYTLYKTYNERGDILSETNPLGQEATHTYDSRGRSGSSLSFSHRLNTTFFHDTRGRIKQKVETGSDALIHTTSWEYDFHDRNIQKIDPFQNATHYAYDPLVNEVNRTDFPPIDTMDEQAAQVATHSTYDAFGREILKIDPNGQQTTYHYNAYGSPTDIMHPDGGRETFRYSKNGKLSRYTDEDGLTICYKNDVFGPVLSKTYVSMDGTLLAEETFAYNGFNLLNEIDREGNKKLYFYDGAGRKISEEFSGHVTEFIYNTLGQLATIAKLNAENALFIHYKRDLHGRVLEEQKTDVSGKLLYKINYTYDPDGNQQSLIRHLDGQEASKNFVYDSFQRCIEEEDADGNVTAMLYHEGHTNGLGQSVLQHLRFDPHGMKVMETLDALGRTVKKETFQPEGLTIACQEMVYDPCGNLLCRKDLIYENGQFRDVQVIGYTYAACNRLESVTRGFGTKDARTTSYTYFPSGKLETKTLPDQVTLAYTYHPHGFLCRLDSSDGQIRHFFKHDHIGHLLYALDENRGVAVTRRVDPLGNVLQELFSTGFVVNKEYDALNRLVSLTMGPAGEVAYTYDPLFMRKVARKDSGGAVLYEHVYEGYDLDGNLTSERLIGGLGSVVQTMDSRGKKSLISSPYFSQQCTYNALGNLTATKTDGEERRYSYDTLCQLILETRRGQSLSYGYDSLYNRRDKNGSTQEVNALNELLSAEGNLFGYDHNGNQKLRQTPDETFHLTYDPLNRLTEATSEEKKIKYLYDPLGRCLTKKSYVKVQKSWQEADHEDYLYHGQNEIGAFSSFDEPKNLRVLGIAKHKDCLSTVGVEIEGKVYAPLLDVQGNICRLVDPNTKAIASYFDPTAFGEELQDAASMLPFNPWRFASKRLDPDLGLVHFGKRLYDPQTGRWLTTDPAGYIDSVNLYQYVFNNPFQYMDPDGQFAFAIPLLVWGAELVLPALSAYVVPAIYAGATAALAYGGYKAVQALNDREHDRRIVENLQLGSSHLHSSNTLQRKKKGSIDENLSDDPFNDPDLEDVSHPNAKDKGRHKFRDKITGEIIEYDVGKPEKPGHKAHDHYHRPNPNTTGNRDYYLDSNRNPVPKGSEDSHLYPPEWVWWD